MMKDTKTYEERNRNTYGCSFDGGNAGRISDMTIKEEKREGGFFRTLPVWKDAGSCEQGFCRKKPCDQ